MQEMWDYVIQMGEDQDLIILKRDGSIGLHYKEVWKGKDWRKEEIQISP